jgi:hypothetical protein
MANGKPDDEAPAAPTSIQEQKTDQKKGWEKMLCTGDANAKGETNAMIYKERHICVKRSL